MSRTKPEKTKVLAIVLIVIAASVAVAVALALLFPNAENGGSIPNMRAAYDELENEYPEISYDPALGRAYINNYVVVLMREGDEGDISAIARNLDADVDDSMGDIGIFRLLLKDNCTYSELEGIVEAVLGNESVEDAYIDPVMLMEGSDNDGKTDSASALSPNDAGVVGSGYDVKMPNDPWNGADWNTDVPRDENWCMEAVHAPQAWSQLLDTDNVVMGQIDAALPNLSHPDLDGSVITPYYAMTGESGSLYITKASVAYPGEHATHVAGTMVATWGNGEGLSGATAGTAHLLSCAYPYGAATSGSAFAQIIKEFVDRDARVINISMGFSDEIAYGASMGNAHALTEVEEEAKSVERILVRLIDRGSGDFVICQAAGNGNDTWFFAGDGDEYGYHKRSGNLFETLLIGGQRGGVDARFASGLAYSTNSKVKSRVIVVGAAGIDESHSSSTETRYCYAPFSNVGSRVDIAAPGVDVYSAGGKGVDGYSSLNGTSMATPIVSSAAALAFAANPALSGPQVKRIVCASKSAYLYFDSGACRLLDMDSAITIAKNAKEKPVAKLIGKSEGSLDLCFLVDTTSSMGDDIDNARRNMKEILAGLADKVGDYRVALVDYRDFANRAGKDDYPARTQLGFSDDDAVVNAINGLSLGSGGDAKETVYSGIVMALSLDWRNDAQKALIILGDAPPLDPEPNTGYTYEDILSLLNAAGVSIDYSESDDRVLGEASTASVSVYAVGADSSKDAEEFFKSISDDTGGLYKEAESASEVSSAIGEAIDSIEIEEPHRYIGFGADNASEQVQLYDAGGSFIATLPLDESGRGYISDLQAGSYSWEIERLQRSGRILLDDSSIDTQAELTESEWYDFPLRIYQQNKALFWSVLASLTALILLMALARKLAFRMAAEWARLKAKRESRLQQPRYAKGTEPMYCPQCGTRLNARKGAFCPKCGARRLR